MIGGTILIALAVLMLYQGFTGKPVADEVRKLLAGEAAFTREGSTPIQSSRISGGGVRTNPAPTPSAPGTGSGGGGRVDQKI